MHGAETPTYENYMSLFHLYSRSLGLTSCHAQLFTSLSSCFCTLFLCDVSMSRRAMDGLPLTVRLLDPPLHEFLPHSKEEMQVFVQVEALTWFQPLVFFRSIGGCGYVRGCVPPSEHFVLFFGWKDRRCSKTRRDIASHPLQDRRGVYPPLLSKTEDRFARHPSACPNLP